MSFDMEPEYQMTKEDYDAYEKRTYREALEKIAGLDEQGNPTGCQSHLECIHTAQVALVSIDSNLYKISYKYVEAPPWKPTVEQLQHLIEKYQAVRFHRSAGDSLELCIFKWALSKYL